MAAQILDGKLVASRLKDELRNEVVQLKDKTGHIPCLVNIMVGEDPSAVSYANSQKKAAEAIGIDYRSMNLSVDLSQEQLIQQIHALNQDNGVNSLMIYKPLPSQMNYRIVANSVDPAKDAEGMTVANLGKMILGQTKIIPCTPASAIALIKSVHVPLKGKEAVVVGRSEIVGKPVSILLLEESATVTVCHSGTSNAGRLEEHIGRADILVVAMGKPHFIKGEWIKPGAIVIDVGINQVDGKMVGDVEFESAKQKAGFITPVPGGVGPVTAVMLMKNVIEAFKEQNLISS